MSSIRMLSSACAILLALGTPRGAAAGGVLWTSDVGDAVRYARRDGSGFTNFASGVNRPMGLAIDEAGGRLYWAERDLDRIVYANLDGSGAPQTLIQAAAGSGLRGVALDLLAGKVYWAANDLNKIQWANLDGTGIEDLPGHTYVLNEVTQLFEAVEAVEVVGLVVDAAGGRLYWTTAQEIWRSNLDGTVASVIVPGAGQPYYVALDLAAGTIYWTDFSLQQIGRANLDGTNILDPPPVSGLPAKPVGIAIDFELGKLWWTLETGAIQRANLDGSGIETVAQDPASAWDIALTEFDAVGGAVPAASTWGLVVMSLVLLTAGTIFCRRRPLRVARPILSS